LHSYNDDFRASHTLSIFSISQILFERRAIDTLVHQHHSIYIFLRSRPLLEWRLLALLDGLPNSQLPPVWSSPMSVTVVLRPPHPPCAAIMVIFVLQHDHTPKILTSSHFEVHNTARNSCSGVHNHSPGTSSYPDHPTTRSIHALHLLVCGVPSHRKAYVGQNLGCVECTLGSNLHCAVDHILASSLVLNFVKTLGWIGMRRRWLFIDHRAC